MKHFDGNRVITVPELFGYQLLKEASMKKLIIIVLLLVPVMLSAQSHVFINRTDDQTGVFIQQEKVKSDRYTLLLQSPQQVGKSFKIVMADTIMNFDPGKTAPMDGGITNLTNQAVHIIFHRTHLHLPSSDWSSSVCFGLNCFAPFVDSTPPSNAFGLDPSVKGKFTMNFNSQDFTHIDSIVDYIRFTSLSGDPGDTISFILKGIINLPNAVENEQPKMTLSHPKIKAVYPSPLISGSEIKVKVSSPRENSLSYSIYDGIGRVVALGVTRQRLSLGDNTIGINSLDGLTNGSYMLKLSFGDGSSDSYFFQVMK